MPHPATRYGKPAKHRAHLTRRELEMLRLAANGNTNETIARWLGITSTTVNHGLRRAYAKLGANDRTHAVAIALVRGLIAPKEIAGVQMLPRGTSVHRNTA